MPTYEYKSVEGGCEHCATGFDRRQSIKAKPLTTCPTCGAKIRRVLRNCAHFTPKPKFSYDRAADAGFTSYQRTDSGLKKIAGSGPDTPVVNPSDLP